MVARTITTTDGTIPTDGATRRCGPSPTISTSARNARPNGRTIRRTAGSRERSFLNSLDDFARRADRFNRRLERDRDARWDTRDEVNALNRDARDVNREIETRASSSEPPATGRRCSTCSTA